MVAAATGGATLYEELADLDVQWLRSAASDLRAKLRRTVSEVVAGGKLLAAARRRLGRSKWKPWLISEAGIPMRSASRLVAVGQAFGNVSDSALLNFTPTALYTLAEPGVPQSIREYAVEQAQDGEEVTAGKVQVWLSQHRDSALPATKCDLRELLKLAPDEDDEDGAAEEPFYDPAEVFAAENWRLLRGLVGTSGTVHLSASADAEGMAPCTRACASTGAGRRSALRPAARKRSCWPCPGSKGGSCVGAAACRSSSTSSPGGRTTPTGASTGASGARPPACPRTPSGRPRSGRRPPRADPLAQVDGDPRMDPSSAAVAAPLLNQRNVG